MAKGIPAGQASFTLKLNDQLSNKMRGVGSRMKRTMGRIGASAKAGALMAAKAITVIAAAATATVAAVVKLGKVFAAYGDKIGKMSIRTGVGAEALQELSYAAEITGTNIDSLSQAMFRARRRIGNMALGGGGPAARALETLGLNAKELSKEKPERQFMILVKALKSVGNEAERNQLAFEIFGDNFRQIQPLINAGADGIDKMRERAKRLGLVLSSREISQAEELTDAFYELGQVLKMTFVKIGAALGPTLLPIIKGLAEGIADITNAIVKLGGGLTVLGAQIKLTIIEMILGVVDGVGALLDKLPGGIGAMFRAVTVGLKIMRKQAQKELTAAGFASQEDRKGIAFDDRGPYAPGPSKPITAEPVATTGILSGFAAQYAAAFGFNRADPKKEEKEMVKLLGEIADAGPLAVQPGGGA